MKTKKQISFFFFSCMFGLIFSLFPIFAEDNTSESSVEDEYLNDIDSVVILGLASSNEYENKLYALKMVENAVNGGNMNPEIMKALCQLAGEGLMTQTRTNGQIINNFPDIRRNACLLMGKVKTEESKTFLVQITLAENEPMVISAAVKSLGDIGMNKDDEVTTAIAFMNRRNQILNPTNSLASEVIDAYEKLIGSVENKKPVIDSLTQIAADYHYNKTVRNKAMKLIRSFGGDASSGSSNSQKESSGAVKKESATGNATTEPSVQ